MNIHVDSRSGRDEHTCTDVDIDQVEMNIHVDSRSGRDEHTCRQQIR